MAVISSSRHYRKTIHMAQPLGRRHYINMVPPLKREPCLTFDFPVDRVTIGGRRGGTCSVEKKTHHAPFERSGRGRFPRNRHGLVPVRPGPLGGGDGP